MKIEINNQEIEKYLEKKSKELNISINDFIIQLILKEKTQWVEFADKMDGLFTPNIVEHINNSREEARENFKVNI